MFEDVRKRIRSWSDDKEVMQSVEKFLNSRWFLAAFALFIFIEQALGGDLIGFTVCAAIFVYVCLFCKSTNATIPVLCMATFCVSTQNSPAKMASGFHLLGKCEYYVGQASDFYGSPEFIFTASVLAAMVVTALLFRLIVFGNLKRAFSMKGLLWGIVFMSLGFSLAGVSKSAEEAGLLFGLIQAGTFFVVYLFYAATLDFDRFSFDYIADVMLTIMFYILALIAYIYATRFYGFLVLSGTWKLHMFSGWGMSLDFGSYLAMTMPACFYKMHRGGKHHAIWLVFAVLAIVGIYFVMARGALVAAGIVFLAGLLFSLKKPELRKTVWITLSCVAVLIFALIIVLLVTDKAQFFFDYYIKKSPHFGGGNVTSGGNTSGGGNVTSGGNTLGGDDITSGRLTIWERYFGYFCQNPIFGGGFAVDLEYQVANVGNANNGIFSIYSYLAHNVLLQSIGSCGIFGTLTLFVHFILLLRTLLAKGDHDRLFLWLAIIAFLGMSLLDTIFYKAQFTFLYLALLAACEADVWRKEKELASVEKRQQQLHATKNAEKPRVVFAFVEAGMGHIMPMRSLADAFEKKYGEYCTVVRSKFFSETGNESLMTLERSFVKEVKKYNRNWVYGYFNMFLMEVFGAKLLSKIIMDVYVPGTSVAAREHMAQLQPDMLVSTHWSTNYYAENVRYGKPLTVTYIPDVQTIPLFRYPTDMTLMSTERGYRAALEKYPRLYNADNIRLVSFALRNEAFALSMDKKANRRALGLDEDKLTVVLFEGGYGLGRMGKITQLLVERDLPLNVIAICGKNEKLYNTLQTLTTKGNLRLVVEGFCEKTLEYLAAADVFMGKSGASSVAEATYFGTAIIVTKYATSMERDNAEYYLKDVQNALRIFDAEQAVNKLEEWLHNPEELIALQNNAMRYHERYGAEESADVLWEMLCKRFPSLQKKSNRKAAR